MFFAPLYDDKVIKKKFSDLEITTLQRKTANRWLGMINNKELENETENSTYCLFSFISSGG